jgi:hypothetical protein
MSKAAIFLSAGIPDRRRAGKYFDTADPIAIGAAVSALVFVTLGRRLLVWGGQPAITPMIWTAAADVGVDYGDWVHLYQSRFFEEDFPAENARFKNVTFIEPVKGDRHLNDSDLSLAEMRRRMLQDVKYEAGVFVGGMEGVEIEFDLFRKSHPKAIVLPIASTGGASLLVSERLDPRPSPELLNSIDYIGILHRQLRIRTNERRFRSRRTGTTGSGSSGSAGGSASD